MAPAGQPGPQLPRRGPDRAGPHPRGGDQALRRRGVRADHDPGIAATAGVSPGLLRHHFGSKEELRRACDEHIAETLRRVNAQYLDDLGGAAADRRQVQPFERYIVRALAENSPSAAAIFDEMVTMTEHWLERADEARPDRPAVDRRIRAALISAMASGIPLLHEQLSRTVGADIFGPTAAFGRPRPARHLLPPAHQRRRRRRGGDGNRLTGRSRGPFDKRILIFGRARKQRRLPAQPPRLPGEARQRTATRPGSPC